MVAGPLLVKPLAPIVYFSVSLVHIPSWVSSGDSSFSGGDIVMPTVSPTTPVVDPKKLKSVETRTKSTAAYDAVTV